MIYRILFIAAISSWRFTFGQVERVGCNEAIQFQCYNTTKAEGQGPICIPKSYVCDGESDCWNNSDESPNVDCSKYELSNETLISCPRGEFRCKDNERCIPEDRLCNNLPDCEDRSDESHRICKPFICNHESLFICKNDGRCLRKRYLCDGDNDCGEDDNSDEEGCLNIGNCPKYTFACTSANITTCKSEAIKCNGIVDCDNGTDEENCPPKYPDGTYCENTELECKNHICISFTQLCDQVNDCLDGFDESQQVCQAKKGIYGLFQRNLKERDDWSEIED